MNPAQLPESLQTLAQHCGMGTVAALVAAFGGCHLCIPKTLTPGHRLLRVLAPEAAQHLVNHYGGASILIPKATQARMAERNAAIRQDRDAGFLLADIAIRYGLSERQIYSILRKPR